MEDLNMALIRSPRGFFSSSLPSLMDKYFEDELTDWGNENFAGMNSTLPAVNVKENDDEFMIEVAAPGMRKEDFKVTFDNGRLTISAEKREEMQEGKEKDKYSRQEFRYESFQRAFSIPENIVEGEKIEAKYCDGLLCVSIPKKETVKPRAPREISIG